MDAYCQEVCKLEGRFRGLELHHIPRKQNPDADALSKMAAERKPAPNGVFVNDLNAPSSHERQPDVVLVFGNVTNKIRKRTDTAVAFTQEYSVDGR